MAKKKPKPLKDMTTEEIYDNASDEQLLREAAFVAFVVKVVLDPHPSVIEDLRRELQG